MKRDRFRAVMLLTFALCAMEVAAVRGATLTWKGGEGDWADSTKWDGGAVPGVNDVAMIGSGVVWADWESRIAGLTLSGGQLVGFGPIQITGAFVWTGGVMAGHAKTTVEPGATATISGGADKELGRPFENKGALTWEAGRWLIRGGAFTNSGTMTVANDAQLDGGFHQSGAGNLRIPAGRSLKATGTLTLYGAFESEWEGETAPALGQSFTVLEFAERTGSFEAMSGLNVAGGFVLEPVFGATSLVLTAKERPQPRFASSGLTSGHAPGFRISEIAGQTFVLESRASLDANVAWTGVLTNANSTILFDFVEQAGPHDAGRFFRVRLAD